MAYGRKVSACRLLNHTKLARRNAREAIPMADESSLLNTDEPFRLVVEGVLDYAIFLLDLEGRIITWNAGAARLLGYDQTEAIGKDYSCIFTSEDSLRGEPEQEMRTAREAGRSEDVRWHVRKDGTRFWGDGVVTTLSNEDGSLRCYVKVLRDRTDQKELEDLLRHRVETLLDVDEKKNVLIAILAHELRNPLAGIANATQILLGLSKDLPALDHPLKIIVRQTSHIQQLIDELTDMVRVRTGKIQLNKQRVEVASVVQAAVEIVRPVVEVRKHHLAVSLPAQPIYLHADPTRLQQILVNLLTNAAKYTDEGGQITLSGTVQDNEVVIRIRDTGIGIAPDMLPRIFDLFTQASQPHGQPMGGLGIGLNLVKNLVELHGGSVQARSEGLGKGSEFTVRLPG
jgi:PAS domain S-box-containing protein